MAILHVGPYLTPVDLADIATQLDEDERERMAEGDVTSQDYQEFLKVLDSFLTLSLPRVFKTEEKIFNLIFQKLQPHLIY